ncbi:TrbL/VirB6 plasmid conjugal transfer protein [Caballeronia terrestris]|uniref:TrbL/VirB6 plasmid conjugal transfer protein n=1 Tax=Caballeronia terrestris TaxID=1226301 RepID=A0A158KDB5_9BURK|nr:type IV secretion system protein [Caballeronia terrestris]SAL78530.1 TrbL/VirB6 plasmid conjugal transfer protein [Caballeronia terrestris]
MATYNATSQIFTYMDTVVSEFVATNLSNVVSFVAPMVALGLTMALMIEGLFLMGRPNGEPLSSLVNRFVRYAIIVSIASAGGWYQTTLANTAMHIPDELASVFIVNGQSGANAQSTISNSIDQAMDNGLTVAKKAFEHAGVLSGPHLASLVLGITVLFVTAIMCGIGAGLILMSKVMLGITVCFGPIFIFLLVFESTKSLFTRWMGSVINYGLVTVLFSAVFGLLLYFFKAAVGAAAVDNPTSPVMVSIVTCVLVLVITWFVLKEIPHMASSWGQGVSADIFRHMRQNRGGGSSNSGGADKGSGGGNAGQSGGAGSRGAANAAGSAGSAGSARSAGSAGSAGSAANSASSGQAAQAPTNGLARGSRRST